MNARPRRAGERLACSAFDGRATFFYGVLIFMLALFAIGAVHELIPGLCLDGGEGDDECPFCKLVHTMVLVVLALTFIAPGQSSRPHPFSGANACILQVRRPHYLLRAPPAH